MSRQHRPAISKFRCGVAQIRLETGRYIKLKAEDRKCPFCIDFVEDESQLMIDCGLHDDIRQVLYNKIV